MNEQIDIWLVGNTGLRNPNRIQDGFKVFAGSPYVGNLHGKENEIGFMNMMNKPYEVRGFKLDSDFMPVSAAGGGKGDLYCEFDDFTILTEVTMSTSSRQEAMEGEPVRRHVSDAVLKYEKPVYGMFIAVRIDTNTIVVVVVEMLDPLVAKKFWTLMLSRRPCWHSMETVLLHITRRTICGAMIICTVVFSLKT